MFTIYAIPLRGAVTGLPQACSQDLDGSRGRMDRIPFRQRCRPSAWKLESKVYQAVTKASIWRSPFPMLTSPTITTSLQTLRKLKASLCGNLSGQICKKRPGRPELTKRVTSLAYQQQQSLCTPQLFLQSSKSDIHSPPMLGLMPGTQV